MWLEGLILLLHLNVSIYGLNAYILKKKLLSFWISYFPLICFISIPIPHVYADALTPFERIHFFNKKIVSCIVFSRNEWKIELISEWGF